MEQLETRRTKCKIINLCGILCEILEGVKISVDVLNVELSDSSVILRSSVLERAIAKVKIELIDGLVVDKLSQL